MFGFDILKQAREMAEKMKTLDEELRARTVEATVGGGVVSATCNGKLEIIRVKIAPEVVRPEDVELLEDLVLSAVSEAQRRALELAQAEMGKVSSLLGNLNLPGLGT